MVLDGAMNGIGVAIITEQVVPESLPSVFK
jgi:hypothetical protein